MIDSSHIDALARRRSTLVPAGLREDRKAVRRNAEAVLPPGLARLAGAAPPPQAR